MCLTVSNQYGSDEKCKTVWVTTTGSNNPEKMYTNFRVFPNPTTGDLYWTGLPATEQINIRVYTPAGSLMQKQEVSGNHPALRALEPGLYYLRIQSKHGGTAVVKVLISSE